MDFFLNHTFKGKEYNILSGKHSSQILRNLVQCNFCSTGNSLCIISPLAWTSHRTAVGNVSFTTRRTGTGNSLRSSLRSSVKLWIQHWCVCVWETVNQIEGIYFFPRGGEGEVSQWHRPFCSTAVSD